MKEVRTTDVQAGMILARDVINDRGQRILRKGTEMSTGVLLKLRSIPGVATVYVDDPQQPVDLSVEWETRHKATFEDRFTKAPPSPYMKRFGELLESGHRRYFLWSQGIEIEPQVVSDEQGVRTFAERILGKIEATQQLPSLPIIIDKLDKVLNDPNADAAKISEVLILDPSLAARILRMINSAFFGLTRRVERIDQAVVFLGVNQIRSLALTASVFSMFDREKSELFDPLRFWEHSMTTAIACRLIAKTLNERPGTSIDVEDAFLAGLLHDIGKIVLAQYFYPAYEKIIRTTQARKLSLYDAELFVLGLRHTDIARRLFEVWQIKGEIADAAHYHHEPGSAGTFAYVVHLADLISRGLGFLPDTDEMPRLDPHVYHALDLTDGVLERIAFQVLTDYEETRSLLQD